jgi:predicted GNAT family acetyltransferase
VQVIRNKTAAEFLARTKPWLEKAEAKNNLILGIAAYFASCAGQLKGSPYFLTVEGNGTIVGAALMAPPRRILLTRMPHPAVTLLADYLLEEAASVPGVLGPKAEAKLFANYWTSKTGRSCHLKMSERIYACEKVIPPVHAFGQLKPAKEVDQALLSDWCEQFCIDARIDDETVYFKAQLPRKLADQSIFVWETDEAVSMAAIERETAHGVAISWVYTPRHLRNKGYATACVAALTQRMLDSGKQFCCLYTDLTNPTSNSIYQKIGYQPICDVQDWIFE